MDKERFLIIGIFGAVVLGCIGASLVGLYYGKEVDALVMGMGSAALTALGVALNPKKDVQ